MCNNIENPHRTQLTVRCKHIACWERSALITQSVYEIFLNF